MECKSKIIRDLYTALERFHFLENWDQLHDIRLLEIQTIEPACFLRLAVNEGSLNSQNGLAKSSQGRPNRAIGLYFGDMHDLRAY